VVYQEVFADKSQALKRERQLKGWKNKARIKLLIERAELAHPD